MRNQMHMTHLRTLAAGLGVCVAIGLFACGNGAPGGSSGPASACNGSAAASSLGAPAQTIQATDTLLFVPATSTAATGDVVEFKNNGSVVHTVTFQDNNDACLTDNTLAPGGTWEVKFTQPGTYHYLCTIHAPNMAGVLTVSGSASAPSSSASASASGSPGATPSASATPSPAP
jgi:plastocyanin